MYVCMYLYFRLAGIYLGSFVVEGVGYKANGNPMQCQNKGPVD